MEKEVKDVYLKLSQKNASDKNQKEEAKVIGRIREETQSVFTFLKAKITLIYSGGIF